MSIAQPAWRSAALARPRAARGQAVGSLTTRGPVQWWEKTIVLGGAAFGAYAGYTMADGGAAGVATGVLGAGMTAVSAVIALVVVEIAIENTFPPSSP